MLRVAFDVTVSGRTQTGVGVYARELSEALRARQLELVHYRHPLVDETRPGHRLLNGARLTRWFGRTVHRDLSADRVSVYHSTTSVGPVRRRRPIVLTVHDTTHVTMPANDRLADRAFRWQFSTRAIQRADAILTASNAAAESIEDVYGIPSSRIRVTPLGVADAFRRVGPEDVERVRAKYRIGSPYVLYVGAQPARKNLERLVDAFFRLTSPHADLRLVLAGPSNRRNRALANRIAGHPSRERILQIAVENRADLPGLYAGASCLAYVSLCEGFGLPIVEAMAACVPVVASNRSSMVEVAGDAALCVDPESVDAIADGIDRVLVDTSFASELRARGRQRSLAFDWRRTADLTERAYREVAGA